jgi:hypothetical protein
MKIDPDTKFRRRILRWPTADLAGTVANPGERTEHLQGGIQLFQQETVIRIVESGFFSDPVLRDPLSYAWDADLARHAKRTGYLCTDALLRAAKLSLGLSWENWDEVLSHWKQLPPRIGDCAVTHPHKRQEST